MEAPTIHQGAVPITALGYIMIGLKKGKRATQSIQSIPHTLNRRHLYDERDNDKDDERHLRLGRLLQVPAHGAHRCEEARVQEVTKQEVDNKQYNGSRAWQVLQELTQLFQIRQ